MYLISYCCDFYYQYGKHFSKPGKFIDCYQSFFAIIILYYKKNYRIIVFCNIIKSYRVITQKKVLNVKIKTKQFFVLNIIFLVHSNDRVIDV